MSSDLKKLSDEATHGEWFAWDRGVGWHIALDPQGNSFPPEGFRTDLEGPDVRFIVALVNAYRSGQLVERDPVRGGE